MSLSRWRLRHLHRVMATRRFTTDALEQLRERLVQLGLHACPICRADSSIEVYPRPIVLSTGDVYSNPARAGSNILFALRIECGMCGYLMLFDHEKFFPDDVPTLELDSEQA